MPGQAGQVGERVASRTFAHAGTQPGRQMTCPTCRNEFGSKPRMHSSKAASIWAVVGMDMGCEHGEQMKTRCGRSRGWSGRACIEGWGAAADGLRQGMQGGVAPSAVQHLGCLLRLTIREAKHLSNDLHCVAGLHYVERARRQGCGRRARDSRRVGTQSAEGPQRALITTTVRCAPVIEQV